MSNDVLTNNEQEQKVPKHIAFILDGNRRWARQNGLSINKGHKKGAENIENLCNWCQKYNIPYLTLYCLSVENLNRSKAELKYLFACIEKFLSPKQVKEYAKNGVKLRIVGDATILPKNIAKIIQEVNSSSCENVSLNLQLCIGYGGRNEIVNAVKHLVNEKTKAEEITEESFEKALFTGGLPDVDFLIRTGGDKRISNFLLWKMSYAELYFCEKYFPEFGEEDFLLALYDFRNRMRRYGK